MKRTLILMAILLMWTCGSLVLGGAIVIGAANLEPNWLLYAVVGGIFAVAGFFGLAWFDATEGTA